MYYIQNNPRYQLLAGSVLTRDIVSDGDHPPLLHPKYGPKTIIKANKHFDFTKETYLDQIDINVYRKLNFEIFDKIAQQKGKNYKHEDKIIVGYQKKVPIYGTEPSKVFKYMKDKYPLSINEEWNDTSQSSWNSDKYEKLFKYSTPIYYQQVAFQWLKNIQKHQRLFHVSRYQIKQRSDYVCYIYS